MLTFQAALNWLPTGRGGVYHTVDRAESRPRRCAQNHSNPPPEQTRVPDGCGNRPMMEDAATSQSCRQVYRRQIPAAALSQKRRLAAVVGPNVAACENGRASTMGLLLLILIIFLLFGGGGYYGYRSGYYGGAHYGGGLTLVLV